MEKESTKVNIWGLITKKKCLISIVSFATVFILANVLKSEILASNSNTNGWLQYEDTNCLCKADKTSLNRCEKIYETGISVNSLEDAENAILKYLEYAYKNNKVGRPFYADKSKPVGTPKENIEWIKYYDESVTNNDYKVWNTSPVKYIDGSYFWWVRTGGHYFSISHRGEIYLIDWAHIL